MQAIEQRQHSADLSTEGIRYVAATKGHAAPHQRHDPGVLSACMPSLWLCWPTTASPPGAVQTAWQPFQPGGHRQHQRDDQPCRVCQHAISLAPLQSQQAEPPGQCSSLWPLIAFPCRLSPPFLDLLTAFPLACPALAGGLRHPELKLKIPAQAFRMSRRADFASLGGAQRRRADHRPCGRAGASLFSSFVRELCSHHEGGKNSIHGISTAIDISTAILGKTLHVQVERMRHCVFSLLSWLRHCLCIACYHCFPG